MFRFAALLLTVVALTVLALTVLVLPVPASGLAALPAENAENLPARPIGPEDLLTIAVYGAPELSRSVRVSEEGAIHLPMLAASIQVQGMMPVSVEETYRPGADRRGRAPGAGRNCDPLRISPPPDQRGGSRASTANLPGLGKGITLLEALAARAGLECGGWFRSAGDAPRPKRWGSSKSRAGHDQGVDRRCRRPRIWIWHSREETKCAFQRPGVSSWSATFANQAVFPPSTARKQPS